MGEAKTRREALRRRAPLAQDLHVCPRCQSRRTVVEPGPAMALSHVPTLFGVCADCKTVWEAFPDGWSHDVCEGEPCDNCAFRPGAPEHEDTAEWRSLLAKLRMGQEFKCHKGAPLIIDPEAGTVEFDAAWVNAHGRTCAGFHRAIMTKPGWHDEKGPPDRSGGPSLPAVRGDEAVAGFSLATERGRPEPGPRPRRTRRSR